MTVDTGPPTGTILDAFRRQARQTPGAPAVTDTTLALTYDELDRRSDALAAEISRRLDGRRDPIVGICLDGADTVVSILAIFKAGAAYVPLTRNTLNPGRPVFPRERLDFMISDVDVALVVTSEDYAATIGRHTSETIVLADLGSSSDPAPAVCAPAPTDIAYVLYTSGSSGRPKAVAIEHGSVVNLWRGLQREIRLPRRSLRISLNAPLGFDPSVQQLTFLASGHELVIVPDAIRGDGRALLDFVTRTGLNVLDCTPAQLRLLVSAGLHDQNHQLVAILCGGEAPDRQTWSQFADQPNPRVYNLYGPTECTVDSTVTPFTGPEPFIGWPLPGVRVLVMDADRTPLPAGIAGELAIAGPGVGRGYVNRPELTAARFHEAYLDGAPERVYLTGDRGVQRPDGSFEFLGRLDRQVKMRGYRIEIEEVEHAIRRHPRVAESAVVLRRQRSGDERLYAYFVLRDGFLTTEELRAFLRMWVPDYMVPFAFVRLDSMPLTTNGKLDYAALPEPSGQRPLGAPAVAAASPLEAAISSMWTELLSLNAGAVGVSDDFFDLGGDSLLAVNVAVRLEEHLGREIPLDLVVRNPTIADLARALEARGLAGEAPGESDAAGAEAPL